MKLFLYIRVYTEPPLFLSNYCPYLRVLGIGTGVILNITVTIAQLPSLEFRNITFLQQVDLSNLNNIKFINCNMKQVVFSVNDIY